MKEFNYENHKNLIKTLKKDYSFTCFSKIKFSNEPIEKKVLLRHDVDLSLEKALEMAEIEHEMGVSAIYFLFLRSPFYNIFSVKEEKIIKKIIQLQHYIGLHFDFAKYDNHSISQMSYQIKREIDFMQDFYSIKLDSVSFHRPLSLDFFSRLELSNYPHSYEPVFLNNFKYFADSRANWRFGHPLDSPEYAERKNLHILIHPIWWNETTTADVDCIKNFSQMHNQKFQEHLNAELKCFWEEKEKEKS